MFAGLGTLYDALRSLGPILGLRDCFPVGFRLETTLFKALQPYWTSRPFASQTCSLSRPTLLKQTDCSSRPLLMSWTLLMSRHMTNFVDVVKLLTLLVLLLSRSVPSSWRLSRPVLSSQPFTLAVLSSWPLLQSVYSLKLMLSSRPLSLLVIFRDLLFIFFSEHDLLDDLLYYRYLF